MLEQAFSDVNDLLAALEGSGSALNVPSGESLYIFNVDGDDVIIDGLTLLDLCFQVEGKPIACSIT